MPSATLLYTAEWVHPSRPDHALLEIETSIEVEWDDEQEDWFTVHGVYLVDDKWRNGIRLRKHIPLPLLLAEWVRSHIETDRQRIAKALCEADEDVVVVPGGGRLVLPEPF